MQATRPESAPRLAAPVVVGLGANLGEPVAQLRRAVHELAARLGTPGRVSSLYRTGAVGPAQPDFVNAAVLLDFPGDLERLLDVTQAIEGELGRVRRERWGPRTADLDLLFAGERVVSTERLVVPHPFLLERAFALVPLLELLPDAREPGEGSAYAPRLAAFHSQRIERMAGPEWAELPGVMVSLS